jgi:hypothetical protein
MNRRADWLAWSLQFIAGFLVGAVIAFGVVRDSKLGGGEIGGVALGGGLLVAAFASHYGDRLWLGEDSYRVVPPGEFPQSRVSLFASIASGVFGLGLLIYFYLRGVGVLV